MGGGGDEVAVQEGVEGEGGEDLVGVEGEGAQGEGTGYGAGEVDERGGCWDGVPHRAGAGEVVGLRVEGRSWSGFHGWRGDTSTGTVGAWCKLAVAYILRYGISCARH